MTATSASIEHLLSHFERIESTDQFLKNAVEDKQTTSGAVHMQLWTAFNNFQFAEEAYNVALVNLQSSVEREMKYIVKGNTASPTWIAEYSKQAATAAADMAEAVKLILTLKAVYKTL